MIVLDTTILTYAVGSDHPLREPCRRIVDRIHNGVLPASTTPEVIQEFVHVYARRRSRRDAGRLGRHYAQLLSPLLVVLRADLDAGIRLFEQHPELGAFDAVLAATALREGAKPLVSADRAFAAVPGLSFVDPSTPGLGRLLDG